MPWRGLVCRGMCKPQSGDSPELAQGLPYKGKSMRNRGVSSPMPFLLIPRSKLRGGFIIKITLLDTATFRDRQEKGDFQAFTVLSAVSIDEPDLYYARLVCNATSNFGKYCNPEFDKLFQEQSQTFD